MDTILSCVIVSYWSFIWIMFRTKEVTYGNNIHKKPIVEKRKLYLTDLSNKQVGVD